MTDRKTPYLKLPLPHRDVSREENVDRLQNALGDVDAYAARNDAALAALDAELTCKVGVAQSTAQSALAEAAAARRAADEAKAVTGTASSVSPTPGGIPRAGADGKIDAGWLPASLMPAAHALCEFYYFRHPTLKPGFQPAQGGIIANAATAYPAAWAYLQTAEGQLLCRTEAEWQAMNTAIWHTNADGSTVGWNGIGGAPFYVQDLAGGTLRLPDLRGMYAEAAGFDALNVGGVHGDGVRQIAASHYFGQDSDVAAPKKPTGAFYYGTNTRDTRDNLSLINSPSGSSGWLPLLFNSARVIPAANKVQGRAWVALACVYLGQPAS